MKQLIRTTLTLSTILLLTACGQGDGEGKQNSEHGLLNTPPVAQAQTKALKEDHSVTITLKAIDEDNDTLGYKVTTAPKHGKLEGKAPNLNYVPHKDYNGKDSFSFIANDGLVDSNETVISMEIAPVADLLGLHIEIQEQELNKDTNTSYTITPQYDEGELSDKLKTLQGLTLSSNPSDAVTFDTTTQTLKVLKDGNITIQAKLGTINSNQERLSVYWEVNGHRLPPEPDKALNDSTLLGIDANHNGVRDDVERWIYEEYKDKHPIHMDVAMQGAKAWQKVLEDPTKAREIYPSIDNASFCEGYFRVCVSREVANRYQLQRINTSDEFVKIIFNNKSRWDAYIQYDTLLSGGVYSVPKCENVKKLCDFNPNKYEE